jgi:aminopeptidase N
MLDHYTSAVEDKTYFLSRVSAYLSKYAYSNAENEQLWQALDKPNLNVLSMMLSWTNQPGYPVLIVEDNDEDDGSYTVRQERFIISHGINLTSHETVDMNSLVPYDETPKSQYWWIPVVFSGHGKSGIKIGGLNVQVIKSIEPVVLKSEGASILLLNKDRRGFYRVSYPPRIWKMLIRWVEDDMLSPVDRGGLLRFVVL